MSNILKVTMILFLFVSLSFSETKLQITQKKNNILTKEERTYLKEKPLLSIAVLENWEKVSYYNKENKLVGFNIDMLNQININLGINLIPKVFHSWSEAFLSVKNGNTDGIMSLSWSKEREKYFTYSLPYFFYPHDLIVRKNETSIKSLKDLAHKLVGVNKNSITINALKRLAPLSQIYEGQTENEILALIAKNELDAALFGEVKAEYLKKYTLKVSKKVFIKEGNLHIGSYKKNKIASSIINKGVQSLSKEQIQIFNDKWYKKEKITSIFTKEEENYIKNSPSIKVGMSDWKPIIFLKNNELKGLAGEMLKKAFDISGLKYTLEVKSWNNLMESFKNKELDLIPSAFYNKDREKFALYSEPYAQIKEYIYVKQNSPIINGFKDLLNKNVAIVKGSTSINELKKLYENITIVETVNLEDSIIRLLKNEVDALFDSKIAVEHKLKELGVLDLIAISQKVIKENNLHFIFKKEDIHLRNIIQKSLYSIPTYEKNAIILKWLGAKKIKKEVSIAFSSDIEPYVLNKEYLKGIEYDLIKKILNKSNVKITKVKNFPLFNMNNVLAQNNDIDISVGVKDNKDNFFYSDDFISFQNVVVSRVADNFYINKVKDLKNKSIIAFSNAYEYLGPWYEKEFNLTNRDLNYSEASKYENMVRDFLNKEVDLIILDKNIFSWYLKKLSNNSIDEYKFDYIFPEKNTYKIAFRSSELRDVFNSNLEKIKDNGEYEDVFFDYVKSNIYGKVQISSLLASLVSKSIFNNNQKELEKIVNVFSSHDYIDKIEIFDNEEDNKMIFSSSVEIYKKFFQQNSYYLKRGIPIKVGYLKIYFNEKELKKYASLELIPKLSSFEKLDTFVFIKDIYKDYNYHNNKISFTLKEKRFIENNPIIYFSQMNWQPFSFADEKNYTGLFADYLKIIEEKTKLTFQLKKVKNNKELSNNFNTQKIEIIPKLGKLKSINISTLKSKDLTHFNFVIVTNNMAPFLKDIEDVSAKTLALPLNSPAYNYIKKHYPNTIIIERNSIKDALSLVSSGNAYAFISSSEVAIYFIQNFFPELKIAGISDEQVAFNFLIQEDYSELHSIINKVIRSISRKEKLDIKNKWINTDITTEVDKTIIYQILVAFAFVLLIILYFLQKLASAKKKIEQTKIQLEEQKNFFEALFNGTTDGLVIIEDGKLINCNNALLKMYNIKDLASLKNGKPGALAPLKQNDGTKSLNIFNKSMKKCIETGSASHEILVWTTEKKEFWIQNTLIKISINNRNLIYSIVRDITSRKTLENEVKQRSIDFERANEELEDSNEELQTMIQNLKNTQKKLIESEKMASLGGLVAGVAHEINTPVGISLTGISHFEEISKEINKLYKNDEMSQESFEEYLSTSYELSSLIHKNLRKAADLVRSFKQVAVDQSSEEKRTFNVSKYAHEVLLSLHSFTKKTKIDIIVNSKDDITINSYPGAFSQIITNLVMNSIIHAFIEGERGKIIIDLEKKNDNLFVTYQDNGRGIKKEHLYKIFDPFFTTNRDNGGSGLGLNIIYNIITSRLNGKITCESIENEGILFLIILPLQKNDEISL
ncbi:MAG: hypothetical protein COA66_04615 [Arcobacter sp.]|nr:MAG: hypothetical protein COA66_04615 [Arcobacter sp.]